MADDGPYFTAPNGLVYSAGGDHANCTISICPIELSVYGYRASLASSIAMIVLYAICLVFQGVLGFRYKAWSFMTAMILGCLTEILGYVGRVLMWKNPWEKPGFIMQIGLSFHMMLAVHCANR